MSRIFDESPETIVAELYIAYLDRAPDPEGFAYWLGQYNEVMREADGDTAVAFGSLSSRILDAASSNGEFSPEGTIEDQVSYIYENILGRSADIGGLIYWSKQLENGASWSELVAQVVDAALSQGTSRDALYLENRTEVAIAYAGVATSDDPAPAKAILVGVNENSDTVATALSSLGLLDGELIDLTVGRDTKVGSAANDIFDAPIVQNDAGLQVNTLGSGDRLDGKGGLDTLNAEITAGAFVNGSFSMPIKPVTANIEIINLSAQLADVGGLRDQVFVNALDMTGVTHINSVYSSADLTVTNLTTKANANYDSARDLSSMTVGMKYSGNSNAANGSDASDFTVTFDQDFIVPERSGKLSVSMDVMNEDAYDATNGARPLEGVYIAKMAFTLNGEQFDLAPYIQEEEGPDGAGDVINTYAQLLAAVEKAIAALKADNAGNAALQTLSASIGDQFFSDISPTTGELRAGQSIVLSIESANGEDTFSVTQNDLTLNRAEDATVPNNNRYERAQNDADYVQTVAINVDLEKVGVAGDGGTLTIGSDFNNGLNVWSDTYAGKGIQEFYTTVYGDTSKPSSLAGLHSTGNNLRVVTVKSEAGRTVDTAAALVIGNTETEGTLGTLTGNANALKDVQTFDASEFVGDLTLHAALTAEVTAKYLTLDDGAPDEAAADNVSFIYSGGAGDDSINLVLSSANLAAAGTTTREDFNLQINGNGGNDEIVVAIEAADGQLATTAGHWYTNSQLNANLNIVAGSGDDTVTVQGSGDWVINLGTGSDTLYLAQERDDAGAANAVWVFNTATDSVADRNINDLESAGNTVYAVPASSAANLSVTFRGLESKDVAIRVNTTAANIQSTNTLAINQAIKAAINTDPVLSKLLIAEDGPANTLVVRSLIDGTAVDTDLSVNIEGVTGVTYQPDLATDGTNELQGRDAPQFSSETTILVHQDGTDVIVLESSNLATETIIITGTYNVDYGPVVIVNLGDEDVIKYRDSLGVDRDTVLDGTSLKLVGSDVIVAEVWVADADNVTPEPVQTVVNVADLQTYDASTGAFKFVLDFTAAGVKIANIGGFGDDDTIELINPVNGSSQVLDSSTLNSLDLVVGDVVNLSNAWAIQLFDLAADLVADVVAAGDNTEAGFGDRAAVLEAVWGDDWFVTA